MAQTNAPAPKGQLEEKILTMRGQRVMLDEDLAEVYSVSTKRLNEQVTRNADRFPDDFSFRLTSEEFGDLRSHFATAKWAKKRYPPRVQVTRRWRCS